ncbi:hypothetical protein LCGC14_0632500 [marine sediment metagenome]|uniref:Uncharacterized protein n=1 Tax=marine sediment metagenome TaxID=412755 RepID=A0A0F9R1D5_9ZZZZ
MIEEIIFGAALSVLLISSVLLIIYGNRFVNTLNEFVRNSEEVSK